MEMEKRGTVFEMENKIFIHPSSRAITSGGKRLDLSRQTFPVATNFQNAARSPKQVPRAKKGLG